jgi:hypothetical protein
VLVLANADKGETAVTIDGTPYVLASTFNSLIALQQLFKDVDGTLPSVDSILQRAQRGDLSAVRGVFWSTLLRHHPQMTVEQAGELIDAAGGPRALNALVDAVHQTSAADGRDVEAVQQRARPRKTAAPRRRSRGQIGARLT